MPAMTPRLPLALLACALSAAPAAATDPLDRVEPAVWTGNGHVSPAWPPVPVAGSDPWVTVSGPVQRMQGAGGTCTSAWWEDPSGLPWGMPFQFAAWLSCDGGVASWSGSCVVTRFATIRLVCFADADGAVVEAELAVVPSEVPFVSRFTFAGTLTRTKP
jgi:hypothetical protein